MSVNVNALDKILPYEVEIIKRISKKESLVVLARGLPVEKEWISRYQEASHLRSLFGSITGQLGSFKVTGRSGILEIQKRSFWL